MLASGTPGDLVAALARPHTVLLTGATGFIGSRLAQALSAAGHDVIALTRNPAKAVALAPPFRLITSLDQLPAGLRIDAIVNLAGEPIADGLWTRAKRRRILTSRLRITRALLRLIERLQEPPKVLVSASSIGWYGGWEDEALTEFDGGKNGFLHRVCEAWEQTARRAQRASASAWSGCASGRCSARKAGCCGRCASRSGSVSAGAWARARSGCHGSSATTWCA
jgi:uncharacterized protein (TIGR01777 family)